MLDKRKITIAAVYFAGLLLGTALIMYPAGGSLFQDADFHGFSSGQFGSIFFAQTFTAIFGSLLTPRIAARYGMKTVLFSGQFIVMAAMAILASTQLFIDSAVAYPLMLVSIAFMGFGFGLGLSAYNAYSFDFFPSNEDAAVVAMHVIIGSGLVVGTQVFGQFAAADIWWIAPLVVGGSLALITAFLFTLDLRLSTETVMSDEPKAPATLSPRLIAFALISFAYGAGEGTFSNWATTFLDDVRGYSATEAATGLAIFWFCITAGRVVFAILVKRLNTKLVFFVSPVLVAIAFIFFPITSTVPASYIGLAMGGLSLSFFFPYAVSLASAENPAHTAFASGILVASLQLGIGSSTIIIGLLSDANMFDLPTLLTLSAIHGVVMAGGVLYLNVSQRDVEDASSIHYSSGLQEEGAS